MAAKQRPVADPVYESFEPSTEWVPEPADDVLLVFLPGFKKEQLKVQVTSTRKLRISGERPIGNNKRSRFAKELEIPSNCNTNETSAKFEKGTLSIRLPRNIAPGQTQKPTADAPKPQDQLPKQDIKPKPPIPQKPLQEKGQPPRESVPKPQKPPQEKAQPPRESVPKPQKPPQEKAQPPRESVPKPQKPPQEKAQPPRESVPKHHKPLQESVLKKEEETVVEEAVPKTSTDKPKFENNVPKKEAEEEKESPGDHEKNKRSDVDSINNIPAKIDKPSLAHKYKQVLGGLMVEMKQPKKQMNLAVVLLVIVVIVLSAKSALRSLVKFNKTETSSSDYQA